MCLRIKKENEIVLFQKLYNKIEFKMVFIFIVIIFSIGQFLNVLSPHKLFQINQLILIIMLIVQIIVLKRIKEGNAEIKKCVQEKNEPEVLGLIIAKVEKIPCTIVGEILSILLVFFYIITMFALGCLEKSITGIYGGILGGLVFYIGIQAYIHYIAILYFVYDLKHIEINDYSFYFPALTNWMRKLAHELSYIEKWFLFLGLMYSIVYAINLPRGILFIGDKIVIHTNCNVLFYISWVGILIFFAIAFPLFTFSGRSFLKNVIYNCKCNSINKMENQLLILTNQSTEDDFQLVERLISLTKAISESDDYPLKYSQTIFDKAYTIIISLITLISPFWSIAEEIIFKS